MGDVPAFVALRGFRVRKGGRSKGGRSVVKGDVVGLIDLFVVALPLCPVPVPRAKWWGTRKEGPGRLRAVKAELSGWRLHAWKRQGGQGGGDALNAECELRSAE